MPGMLTGDRAGPPDECARTEDWNDGVVLVTKILARGDDDVLVLVHSLDQVESVIVVL